MKSRNFQLWEGILKRHPEGFGFLIPDKNDYPDVYIPSQKIGSALTNDRVAVRVQESWRRGSRSYIGSVHSILKRDKEFAVGFFHQERDQSFIKNHNLGFSSLLKVSNPGNISVQKGDYVKVKIKAYPKADSFFETELLENFGPVHSSAKDDIKRVMAEQNIPFHFPEEVLNSANSLPEEVTEKDFFDRRDLRDKAFVTIDGSSAQDFDDAIFVEKHPLFYRLYVAIADVSYYVLEDSALDKEALERGNSSYFPDFCSPMLPEKLSNDLCSLKENRDRLVMVQEMDFDFQGERVRADIYPSVIKSRKRLTYTQVQNFLDGLSPYPEIYGESLKSAYSLSQILFKKHIRALGLDLNIPETLVVVDERGETQDILKERRLFSHILIEQFMLSANQAVSAFLEEKKIPLMYRIHKAPEPEKLKSLEKFSRILSFDKPFRSRKNLIRFLFLFKDHKKAPLIHKLVLRSLSQACYSADNKGHYGLNFSSYTHFTSPIRRYCDLLIHRLIKKALSQNPKTYLTPREIEQKAVFISQREQNSVKAERRIQDIKKARFVKKYVGQTFDGVVSSISSFGLFITLKAFDVEGLVRFQDLKGFWETDEWQLSAKNQRSSYRIHFGDEVKILLRASDPLTGKIDFNLLSHKGRPVKS